MPTRNATSRDTDAYSPSFPSPTMSPGPNYDKAKRELFWANDYFGSGRFDEVESRAEKVAAMLEDDHSDEAHVLKHEAKELRDKVQQALADRERKRIFDQAKREVFWAADNAKSGRFDEVPARLEKAEKLIANDFSPEAETLRAEMVELGNTMRAEVAARDQKRNYDRAKRDFSFAADNFNSGRDNADSVEKKLSSIETLIASDQTPDGQALKAEIAALREKIAGTVKPEDQSKVSGALGKVKQARNYIQQNYPNGGPIRDGDVDYFETLFHQAREYLDKIGDKSKAPALSAPLLADIDQIKAQYYPKPAAPAFPTPVVPVAATPPGPNFDKAKREVFWAKDYFESRRFDECETRLNSAEPMIADDHSSEAHALKNEIKSFRDKLDEMVKPEDASKVSGAQGKVKQARNYIEQNYRSGGPLREGDVEFFETLFRQANEYLSQIGDQRKAPGLRAPILAEIEQIRSNYYPKSLAPSPPAVAPVATRQVSDAPPGPNYENAKRKVFWGAQYFDSNRISQIEDEFKAAETLLQGDHSKEANQLRDQIAEVRDKVANTVSSVDQSRVNSAERELRGIRDSIDRLHTPTLDNSAKESVNERLDKAIGLLDLVTPGARYAERLKAPILQQIADIRAQWNIPVASAAASAAAAPSGGPPPPVMPDAAALSWDDQNLLNRVKREIKSIRNYIEQRRTDGLDNSFVDVQKVMSPLPMAYQEPFLAEIQELRVLLTEARQAEAARKHTGRLDRLLNTCEYVANNAQWDRMDSSLASFDEVLAMEEVREGLGPKLLKEYEEKRAAIAVSMANKMKETRLNGIQRPLHDLQELLETNPLAGVDEYNASKINSSFRSYRVRVETGLKGLPEEDADVQRIQNILVESDRKFTEYSKSWATDILHAQVKRTWSFVLTNSTDWEQETGEVDRQPLHVPDLPKTRELIRQVQYYLTGDSSVQRTRDENKGDTVIAAIDAEATSLLEAAGSKMAVAYAQILDVAEALSTPSPTGADRFTLERTGSLISEARVVFENTRWLDPIIARLTALDAKWTGDNERIANERTDLGAKLTAEGLAAWPGIVARSGAKTDRFDPGAAQTGQMFVLEGVYNRAGWDYDGNAYGFSMMRDGIVLAGLYEQHVKNALDDAVYDLKLTIDDHQKWDLVGLVLGPGSIKERQKKHMRHGMDSYDVEEWNPIDCLRFRVIALRAGPVAVGPA
ncbi:hypothetical protein C8F01DRAFT_1098719 [Mycena amicta]|nr:hypothetical protein C8F01DRAFT_1098719 [Mycena amicta]